MRTSLSSFFFKDSDARNQAVKFPSILYHSISERVYFSPHIGFPYYERSLVSFVDLTIQNSERGI